MATDRSPRPDLDNPVPVSTYPHASEVVQSKGPVRFCTQVQVKDTPVTEDIGLPIWARQRLSHSTNSIPVHSGLIISIVPRPGDASLLVRRSRRRWDVPNHGECYFARDTETIDDTPRIANPADNTGPANEVGTGSNPSRQVFAANKMPARYDAEAGSRADMVTRRLLVTRRVVFAASTGGKSELGSCRPPNRPSDRAPADNSSRTVKLIRPLSSSVNFYCYPPYQRRESQQSKMYSLVYRDSRFRKFKRPFQSRAPHILFGSVISNKTTTLRLAKFGSYQTSQIWTGHGSSSTVDEGLG